MRATGRQRAVSAVTRERQVAAALVAGAAAQHRAQAEHENARDHGEDQNFEHLKIVAHAARRRKERVLLSMGRRALKGKLGAAFLTV